MKQRSIRCGTLVKPKGTDEVWEVMARNYNEVLLRHPGCLQSTGHDFAWDKFIEIFEIATNEEAKNFRNAGL